MLGIDLSCSYFDANCGLASIFGVLFTKKPSLIGAAAYFFAHSYGHYDAGINLTEEGAAKNTSMIGIKEMIILASILSVGPLASAGELIKAGKVSKSTGNACAVCGLATLVAVYALYIRRPCYALLYINVSIMLSISLPRVILIGCTSKQDVEIRASKFKWANTISGLAILVVIISEPFFCDGFVRYIGGHAVFDGVLAVDMFIQAFSSDDQADDKAASKKTA